MGVQCLCSENYRSDFYHLRFVFQKTSALASNVPKRKIEVIYADIKIKEKECLKMKLTMRFLSSIRESLCVLSSCVCSDS